MVWDQYTTIFHTSTMIDFKNKVFLEKRSFMEVVFEIFGDRFGYHWLLPVRQGGFYKFFYYEILRRDIKQCLQTSKSEEKAEQSTPVTVDPAKKND